MHAILRNLGFILKMRGGAGREGKREALRDRLEIAKPKELEGPIANCILR